MENGNNKDVKQPEKTGEEESSFNKQVKVGEDVKALTSEQRAKELLEKPHKVEVERFNELNEKAKLFDLHAPLIKKVMERNEKEPGFVETLLESKEKGSLEERMKRLEGERQVEKQHELEGAVQKALSEWSDFEKSWPDIQPIFDQYTKKGLPAFDAMRRGYLAVHPEAASAEAEKIAKERANALGSFSSSASHSPTPVKTGERKLTEGEKSQARAYGKTEEQYSASLNKFEKYLKARGFYDEKLDQIAL